TITGSLSLCSGNSTTLSANASYSSYLWSTLATTQNITTLSASTYTLTVTDANGCTGVSPAVTTNVYTAPTATITASGPTEFCSGGTVDLTASANTSYIWSNTKTTQTVTITTSGTYTVTVTDSHGCTAVSAPTTVNVHTMPAVTITTSTGTSTICAN